MIANALWMFRYSGPPVELPWWGQVIAIIILGFWLLGFLIWGRDE